VVVHTYNPSTWEAEARDGELEDSLGYLGRLLLLLESLVLIDTFVLASNKDEFKQNAKR
jgi:hypothetical protein